MEIIPLHPTLAGEIRGVDLGRALDEEAIVGIGRAWLEHIVLVFRGQELSLEDQLRFGRLFGEIERTRTPEEGEPGAPRVRFVSNRRVEGKEGILPDGAMQLHTDYGWTEKPYKATVLYALEVPDRGGNTLFANAYQAYETLPEELKSEVAGRRALHVYEPYGEITTRPEAFDPDSPRCIHPLVTVHPETGRWALFADRVMTHSIVGLDQEESDRLLERLFEHVERPAFIYEHVWRRGDLVIWDNRCALHGRTDFDPSTPRILRRITIGGARPIPAGGARSD